MSNSSSDSLNLLRETFGEALYRAAERLVNDGRMLDVRVLQNGGVVTGTVGEGSRTSKHRVYIRNQAGECSCGARSPCVHIAAVSIAAAKSSMNASVEPVPAHRSIHMPAQQQRLYYVFSAVDGGRLQVGVWVAQAAANARPDPNSACSFTARGEYPRYVDAQDKQILNALTPSHVGVEVLQQATSSGRAYWQSLHGEPLRAGGTRCMSYSWEVLPNGDQRLRAETDASTRIVLDAERAFYIDPANNEWGALTLDCSLTLLRHYGGSPPVAPEQVEAVNAQLARAADSAHFPRLHHISVRPQARASLHAKLALGGGPTAQLFFVYNGLAVESAAIRAEQLAVRQSAAPNSLTVYEIERDREIEQRLRARLERFLADHVTQSTDSWLAFMLNEAPLLQAEGWDVEVSSDFPYQIVAPDNWYADLDSQPARNNREREWFDLRLGVSVNGQAVNLLPALVSYLQSRLDSPGTSLHRMGEHLLIRLDERCYLPVPIERIQRIADTLVELLDPESGLNEREALLLLRNQTSRLAQLTLDLNNPALHSNDHSMLTRIEELKAFTGIRPIAAPDGFQATLRSYQQEGLGWLQFLRHFHCGGILADDMGLGKTVQTLAHLVLEKQAGRLTRPALIVAPVSVIGNWEQEVRRFAPQLQALTLHGSKRKDSFHAIGGSDIVITAYPLLLLDSETLLAQEFSYLILDEAQTIKNPRAKVSQAARALRAGHRLCLTGTPMENHLGELWSLFDFLQPGFLGDERQFQRLYRGPIEKNGDKERAAALARRVAPFMLRRTKDAVAQELPPKTQIVESIVLDERQRDFYDGIRLAMHRRVREVIEQQGLARSQITVLDALLKLRQACCDPRLVADDAETRTIPSAKLDWLCTVLPELVSEGQRILLFSQFTSMLRLIESAVQSLSIPYLLLTGETQQRAGLVERFQRGEAPLFLISLKAGGFGLNLTAADTVIHYDPWWNPAAEAQATDRAHRIGQDKPVFVYKLIAQGTVEEKIMRLQADKHALASQLFMEHSGAPSRLSAAELEALFAP